MQAPFAQGTRSRTRRSERRPLLWPRRRRKSTASSRRPRRRQRPCCGHVEPPRGRGESLAAARGAHRRHTIAAVQIVETDHDHEVLPCRLAPLENSRFVSIWWLTEMSSSKGQDVGGSHAWRGGNAGDANNGHVWRIPPCHHPYLCPRGTMRHVEIFSRILDDARLSSHAVVRPRCCSPGRSSTPRSARRSSRSETSLCSCTCCTSPRCTPATRGGRPRQSRDPGSVQTTACPCARPGSSLRRQHTG